MIGLRHASLGHAVRPVAGWRVVAYAVCVTALGGMPVWLLSAFAARIGHDLGFDSSGLGLIIGSFFAFCALLSLPSGRAVDALGWRRGIILTGIVAAVCMAAIAGIAFSWVALVAILAIGAISNSTSQPAANLAISAIVSSRRQGLALGVKQAALPVATFLIGISVPLFDHGSDWRLAFVVAAVLAVALAATVGISSPVPRARWRMADVLAVPRRVIGFSRRDSEPIGRTLLLLAIGAGFGTAATMSLGGFIVSYAVERGLSLAEAGQLLAVGSAAGILSRVLSGYVADVRGRGHEAVVAGMMLIGSVGLAVISVASDLALLMVGTVLAYGLGWAWNGVFHLAVVRRSGESPAVATGVVQTAMAIGAMIGPAAFGFTATLSYATAWQASAALMVLGALFVHLGGRAGRTSHPAS